jgi:streptogramin lyase
MRTGRSAAARLGGLGLLGVLLISAGSTPALLGSPPGPSTVQVMPGAVQPVTTYGVAQPTAYPLGITTDSHGNVWFAEDNYDQLVEFVPSNSTFRYYPIPTQHHLAWIWFMLFDSVGNLWFSDEGQPLLWRFSPSQAAFANFSAGAAQPYGLAYDQARSLVWFTSLRTNQVGYFSISGGSAALGNVVTIPGSSPGPEPSGIVVDGAGDVYVALTFKAEIAELNGNDLSVMRTWQLPPESEPVGLALDSQDGRVWFTNHASSFFGYVSLGSSGYREFPTSLFFYDGGPIVTLPYWITVGSGGMVWFDEHFANRIARFDPSTQQLTEFPLPQNNSSPLRLWFDQSTGEVWFSEFSGNAIGWVRGDSSFSQSVEPSVGSAAMDPKVSLSVTASPAPAALPVLSTTAGITGAPDLNFSSTIKGSGGTYSVALATKVAVPGNYTAGFCVEYAATNQCGYLVLMVGGTQAPGYVLDLVYIGLAASAAVLLLVLRRESAGRTSSGPGDGRASSSASRRRPRLRR